MALGMHPASPYPRRGRIAPMRKSWLAERSRERTPPLYGPSRILVNLFSPLELPGCRRLTSPRSAPHNARHLSKAVPAPI